MSFSQLRTQRLQLKLLEEPTVTTQAASSITDTTATGNGTLVNLGGSAVTEKGFVFSTNPQPTTADTKITVAGGTTEAYTGTLTPLIQSTLYHYRAYAINAIGTGYGDDVQFTTTTTTVIGVYTNPNLKALLIIGIGV